MPRVARAVFADVPHHITQRGNRRENVFFTHQDRTIYLTWLSEYCAKHRVDILAYCLMTNHIHLVAVPSREDGLEVVLRPLHMRYAQRINRRRGWKGHLWQGRFFSSALDDAYLWAAMCYVERNPVRAKIVRKAENYRWSSARAHCQGHTDGVLTKKTKWWKQFAQISHSNIVSYRTDPLSSHGAALGVTHGSFPFADDNRKVSSDLNRWALILGIVTWVSYE